MHEWIIVWVGSYQWISLTEAYWFGSRVQLNDSIIWLQWKPTKISVLSFHKAIFKMHRAKDSYGPPYQTIYGTQKLQFPFNVNAWKRVTSTPYGNSHFVLQRGKNDMRASQIMTVFNFKWAKHLRISFRNAPVTLPPFLAKFKENRSLISRQFLALVDC